MAGERLDELFALRERLLNRRLVGVLLDLLRGLIGEVSRLSVVLLDERKDGIDGGLIVLWRDKEQGGSAESSGGGDHETVTLTPFD